MLADAAWLVATLPEALKRVLIAIGQGRSKRGEIANEVDARVDRPLDALVRSRYIRSAMPVGAPLKARPEYRVEDAYLRFWFRMLSSGIQRIEAGQGAAVLKHAAGEWQNHLGWVFEQAAREHAAHLVGIGELQPGHAQVGEWWSTSGEQCQIDVMGLADHRTSFVGEAKWSRQPLGPAAVDDLNRKVRLAPDPVPQPGLILWARGGVRPEVQVGSVRGFGAAEMLRR